MDWKPNVAVLTVLALGLVACAAPEAGPGDRNPNAAGPLLDRAAGNGRIAGPVTGTVIGGFVGHGIGDALDSADVARAQAAQDRAFAAPTGQRVTWANPETGHSGTITFVKDGRDVSGNHCREYEATVEIGGQTEKAYGTACRQVDGIWKVVDN